MQMEINIFCSENNKTIKVDKSFTLFLKQAQLCCYNHKLLNTHKVKLYLLISVNNADWNKYILFPKQENYNITLTFHNI